MCKGDFCMKKIILLFVILLSVASTIAFAASYSYIYKCGTTVTSLDPIPKEDCEKYYANVGTSGYNNCVATWEILNKKIQKLSAGKCEKLYRSITGTYGNTKCSYWYDLSGTEVVSYEAFAKDAIDERCLINLAAQLKSKHPNITTGNVKSGFKLSTNSSNKSFGNTAFKPLQTPKPSSSAITKTNSPQAPSYSSASNQNKSAIKYECSGSVNGEPKTCLNFDPKSQSYIKDCMTLYNQGKCLVVRQKTYQYGSCSCSCPYIYQYGKMKLREQGCQNFSNEEECSSCITRLRNSVK